MSRFWGPPACPSELHWRGLVLRSEVEPPADVWPPGELRLRATLRAGRWAVTPNPEGGWVAAWRYRGINLRSVRATPEAALDALMLRLRERANPPEPLVADLQALAA